MKEKLCEKYFQNKIKPKHLTKFKAKTPQENIIEGFISRKANQYLGSLVITQITMKNGKTIQTEQFVQSFPKIHYWDRRHKLKEDSDQILYHCQEKLDGTCLIIYSLNDNQGNSIEIIPKTRSQAVADQHIQDMYKLIDKKPINEFFKNPEHYNDTLMFELYGVLNKHEITYIDTYIDIKLIGAYIDEKFLDYKLLQCDSDLMAFETPDSIYMIIKSSKDNSFIIRNCYRNQKLINYTISSKKTFPSLYDAISEIKLLLEKINQEYYKNNQRKLLEGVVINGEYIHNGQMYLKIKPRNIEQEAKNPNFVPRRFILKEVQKYFDEFGSNVHPLYEKDDSHYVKYVKYHLKEEFTFEQIEDPRTRKLIKKVFMEVWNSKIPPKSLQNIAEELTQENPNANISELMKIFAKTYPSKKNQSRRMYNIFKSILNKKIN
ncbi:MAG: hypothetical protein E7Z80_02015 [Methanobrevibacter thaueri]|nr:hypothetical protein [Methanobrevibacter thaueri]